MGQARERATGGTIPSGADRNLRRLEAQVGRSAGRGGDARRRWSTSTASSVNLRELQSYADEHGIALWPHIKTHKSPEIGLRQLELGAGGLTVAKTGEAEVFHEAGAPRLLVHYPPFGAEQVRAPGADSPPTASS